jgi:outer membrane protein assembly factor BamD
MATLTRPTALLCLLACALALGACEDAKNPLGYTEDAKRSYDRAMAEYNTHNFITAQNLFREIKRKYSYSKYARLAELRIADADFEQDKFSDAIHEYKEFIHAHRSDTEDISYARARIAEATYGEIPETAIIGQPEERDQGGVVEAYKELTTYLADYPDAKESPRVRELVSLVISRLVRHELYVARFYLSRQNFEAAVARVQYALRNYGAALAGKPGTVTVATDLAAEALLLLGEIYLRMHKLLEARQAFQSIVQGYSQSALAVQARDYLRYLSEKGA